MSYQQSLDQPHHGKHLKALRFLAALLLGLAPLAACSPRDAAYDPTAHFALKGLLVPPDVVRGPVHTANENGIYYALANGRESNLCCWAALHADPLVAKPRVSNTLVLAVYVPDQPVFRERKQAMNVRFYGVTTSTRFANLEPGFHVERIAVPRRLQGKIGSVRLSLNFDFDFVPEPKAQGGTGNHYALLLVSAYFE